MKPLVAIIGAGPAGIAAAIQLKRLSIESLVFEKNNIGGLLGQALAIENYLGFPDGVSGRKLVDLMKRHLARNAIEVRMEEIVRLDHDQGKFLLMTHNGKHLATEVVVASGTKPKTKADFSIAEEVREKVFWEISAMPVMSGKVALVIGGGDAAFDYALNLAQGNEVIIVSRAKTCRALARLQEKTKSHPHVRHVSGVTISAIGPSAAGGVLLETRQSGKAANYQGHVALLAFGREPDCDFLGSGLCHRRQLNKIENLYLAGDVKNGRFRQAAIAVGDGIRTAMAIFQNRQGDFRCEW